MIHYAIYYSALIKCTPTNLMDIISFHKTCGKYGLEVETIPTATFHCSGVLEYKNLSLIQENKYKIFLFSTR